MKKKKYLRLAVTPLILLGSAYVASANVPPPPVNQNLGIPDGVFNNLTETQCRGCHEDPTITKPGYLPDRHHLLVDTAIPANTDVPFSVSTVSGPGGNYECLSCHALVWDPLANGGTGAYVFDTFRDCLYCHIQVPDGATVHHRTQAAVDRDCQACHGLIDNPFDGHYIPTYQASLVTPKTGLGGGPQGEGGCAFCHNAGTDTATGIMVYTNAQTHHSTGVVLGPYNMGPLPGCDLCHTNLTDPNLAIRGCEVCHGVNSLHNIQFDSQPDGVVEPGNELPYYGHIGGQYDCWGCHGFTAANMDPNRVDEVANALCPSVDYIDKTSLTKDTNTLLSVIGSALENAMATPDGDVMVESIAKLRNDVTGAVAYIAPAECDEGKVDIVVPDYLDKGAWTLQLLKNQQISNATSFNITAPPSISATRCQDGSFWATLTINGAGFGDASSGMAYSGDTTGVETDAGPCQINAWSDTQITASCGYPCDTAASVTVNAGFGSASGDLLNNPDAGCELCHGAGATPTTTNCDNSLWIKHRMMGIVTRTEYKDRTIGDCTPTRVKVAR